jgi:predicted HicB family RNase H-like nuclease
MINYKGYIGHFTFDETKNIFYGRVANTHDLIIFQGKSIKETQEAFQDAINEHLEWCKKYGKKPEKSFSLEQVLPKKENRLP